MVVRIVKLEFHENKVTDFLIFFESIKEKVTNFPGCKGMKLLQDNTSPTTIFTYSYWQHPSDLENYRQSEAFGTIWPNIKPWFAKQPEAWSLDEVFDGFPK
jgi:quinol monooxygenase YgiN